MRNLLFCLLLACSPAFAVDYFWSYETTPGSAATAPKFQNHDSACAAHIARQTSFPYVRSEAMPITGTQVSAYCYVRMSNGVVTHTPYSNSYTVRRYGDACPIGAIYNEDTGACDVPSGNAGDVCEGPDFFGMPSIYNSAGQCVPWNEADKPATCKHMASSGSQPTKIWVAFDGDGNPENPTVDKLGCEAQAVSTAHCKMPVPRCGSGICLQTYVSKCEVHVNFTGNVAGDSNNPFPVSTGPGEEGVCPEGVDCTPPDEPVVEESKPCNYMYNGAVVGCESSEFKGDPGEMNCGTVNGGPYTCTKKVPTSTGVDIKTKITTEPQPDGTTKQTKEDEHTKTLCTAPGSCTTQVTNNKTVTIKDGNGNTVSESGSCTGANCSTGKGQTGNCPAGETCEGTEEEEFNGPQNESVPGFGESVQSFVTKVENAPLVAGIKGIKMSSGGSCSIGGASTMIGTISGDGVCQNAHWLDDLYFVFLAMGALAAVRVLMSA